MNKKLVEKFFVNQTTPVETERVLDWFDTPKGKEYLQERLGIDVDLMDRNELRELVPELDSEKLFQSIEHKIGSDRKKVPVHKRDWVSYTFKAAAAILVILLTSVFYVMNYTGSEEQIVEREPIHFQTNEDHHREITLSDGSVVRLNNNSEIIISKDFLRGTREIQLKGEAYFDVAHNPDQPFIIHANHSTVRVLGTAFNVRSIPETDNVQVAVVEGRVSFTNKMAIDAETQQENGVVLTKGQYAYMDIENSRFQVDDVAVRNYLAWNSGKFEFEGQTLQQVCVQLQRIYGVECGFSEPSLKSIPLTAEFTNESLEKTLSVIALSLKLEFTVRDNDVNWSETGQ